MHRWILWAGLALGPAVWACGCADDDGPDLHTDAGPSPDADTDAGPSPDASGDAAEDAVVPEPEPWLLLSSARFGVDSTGRLATFGVETGTVRLANAPNDDVDTVVDVANGTPLALSRTHGLVRVQSPDDPLVTLRTVNVNPPDAEFDFASNPQRVVGLGGDRAYVVPRSRNELVVIDPRPEGAAEPLGTVDLSDLMAEGDMDGVVDPVDALRDGDRVYVTLARSWYNPETFSMQFEGSVLAVVDTTSDALVDMDAETDGVQGIPLEANIGGGGLVRDGHLLYVVASGAAGVLDGGIEVVDLNAEESLGLALREEDVGRGITGIAWVGPTRAYVQLAAERDAEWVELSPSAIRVWDPDTGTLSEEDVATGTSGMRIYDGVLYARSGGTLRRFDAETGTDLGDVEMTDEPIYSMVPVP
jgi:hypothetical protein